MPLLSKKHHGKNTDANSQNPAGQNPGGLNQPGQTAGYPQSNTTAGGYGGTTAPEAGYGYSTFAPTNATGSDYNDPNVSGGGLGASGATSMQPGIHHTTDKNGNPVHPSDVNSGNLAMKGKLEHAMGAVTGSAGLKAKGIAKEQEAVALKAQAFELGHAEKLEQEALARRERAVAHGAHPHLGHLGGLNNDPNANNAGIGAGHDLHSSNIGTGGYDQGVGTAGNTGIGNYAPASGPGMSGANNARY